MNYTQPGDIYNTFNGAGGYIFSFSNDADVAKD